MAVRTVPASHRGAAIRLWSSPSWPVGTAPSGQAWAVEWRRAQVGHPTSYVLLGVNLGPAVPMGAGVGDVYSEALAGKGDDVRFGLTDRNRAAVDQILTGSGFTIGVAAEGLAGSSEVAFVAAARFLATSAPNAWEVDDDSIWARWDQAFLDAQMVAILHQLRSSDVGRRQAGHERLRAVKAEELSQFSVEAILETAAHQHAALDTYPKTPNESLLQLLWRNVPALDPRTLVERFDSFDVGLRPSVLRALAHQDSYEAAAGLNRLLLDEAADPTLVLPHWPCLIPLEQATPRPNALLDSLLGLLPLKGWTHMVGATLLTWAKAGVLDIVDQARIVEVAIPITQRCVAETARRLEDELIRLLYEDEPYGVARSDAGLLLDLLGHLEGDAQHRVIASAGEHADPWVALWAVRPLIGSAWEIPADGIERIAANPEARIILLGELVQVGRLDVVPERHRTQASIAESDLVRWLTYPTELGRPPDEIELLGSASLDDDGQPADLFLFKFRTHPPHWAADKGWTVGAAGPYRREDQPTLASGRMTFSSFTELDELSFGQHVEALTGTVTAWADAHGAGPLPTIQSRRTSKWFLLRRFRR